MYEVLKGHTGSVRCVLALQGGSQLISGSSDAKLKIWEPAAAASVAAPAAGAGAAAAPVAATAATFRCVATLVGHKKTVNAVALGVIVSGSEDETVRVWDLVTRLCTGVLSGQDSEVLCLTELPPQRFYQWVSDQVPVRRCKNSVEPSTNLSTSTSYSGCIYRLTLLGDGRVVSACENSTLRIWNVSKPVSVSKSRPHVGQSRPLQRAEQQAAAIRQQQRAPERLRHMGLCPMRFRWICMGDGWYSHTAHLSEE